LRHTFFPSTRLAASFGLFLFLILVSQASLAITAAQLGMLQSLSEGDRQQLLNALGGGFGVSQGGASLTKKGAAVDKKQAQSSTNKTSATDPAVDEALRVKPGDTLLVNFKQREESDLQALLETMQAEVKKKASVQYEPESDRMLYKLDKYGVLDMPGVGRIALAGLTEEEASSRLNLEPLLQRFQIEITLLPLEPIGQEALKPFGYELFRKPDDETVTQNELMPEIDIPVPKDYVMGPGDVVFIQLYGKDNFEYTLQVSRDGSLSFPGVGVIPVAGLEFDQLKDDLKKRIDKQFIGVSAYITLAELRSFRVFVLGEVEKPGSYLVSGAASITHALLKAEGISEIGSLRQISLKRNGKKVTELDLYDLLLQGDSRKDVRLQPGDVIHVPPVDATVSISGEIRRPAIYEIRSGETVDDLVDMAGGLLTSADRKSLRLERLNDGSVRSIFDVNLVDRNHDFKLKNADVLVVRRIADERNNGISLLGQVFHEDVFQWRKGIRVSDIVSSIDILKPNADSDYVIIKRHQPPYFDEFDVISFNMRLALKSPEGKHNVALQPRDEILVLDLSEKRTLQLAPVIQQLQRQSESNEPSQVVRINGQVRGPGEYPLEAGMRISDLIRAGGRLNESAYTLEAELTRYNTPDGETRRIHHVRVDLNAILAGDEKADLLMQPFDLLNIKEIPLWTEQDKVEIRGEVKFPGTYAIQRGETLSDLLKRVGGLTLFAYAEGAVFTREELRQREQKRLDELAMSLESEIGLITEQQKRDNTIETESVQMAQQVLDKLKKSRAVGRLVIDLPRIKRGMDLGDISTSDDIVLRGGDTLTIPPRMQEVSVIGQVYHPTSHLFRKGLDPIDYINMSGGMTNRADYSNSYVIRANGGVELAKQNWFLPSADVKPGDTVVVPVDADKLNNLKLWSSVSQILYNLSTSLAAWKTLGILD